MNSKKSNRMRRAKRTRLKISEVGAYRLCVHRTPRHIYAQVISPDGGKVIATASTVQKDIAADAKHTGNIEAASLVGKAIAEKSKSAGVTSVAFDRSGFRYHGRVKALADSARENGLEF
ncbi:MAG: 50S ribosomal protein L18 [Gammaproteobacteria bacterium]|jgi:large subunit ribosomal protein L18|nr:50S ribosomal protein L18 [Gammaproteobacteria bacterium]